MHILSSDCNRSPSYYEINISTRIWPESVHPWIYNFIDDRINRDRCSTSKATISKTSLRVLRWRVEKNKKTHMRGKLTKWTKISRSLQMEIGPSTIHSNNSRPFLVNRTYTLLFSIFTVARLFCANNFATSYPAGKIILNDVRRPCGERRNALPYL